MKPHMLRAYVCDVFGENECCFDMDPTSARDSLMFSPERMVMLYAADEDDIVWIGAKIRNGLVEANKSMDDGNYDDPHGVLCETGDDELLVFDTVKRAYKRRNKGGDDDITLEPGTILSKDAFLRAHPTAVSLMKEGPHPCPVERSDNSADDESSAALKRKHEHGTAKRAPM